MILDLAGVWELSDETGEYRCPMRVPGDGITALHEAGLIPDPYWGRNEYDLRWIAERDWTIRRTFDLDRTDVALVLEGVDTVAEVRVNGVEVAKADNAFRTLRIAGDLPDYEKTVLREVAQASLSDVLPLSTALTIGRNEVEIRFEPAPHVARTLADEQPFAVPFIKANNPIPHGNMLRKPACDWGWDWNLALVPFGLLGAATLEDCDGHRVRGITITQHHLKDAVAVHIVASTSYHFRGNYKVTLNGVTREGPVRSGGFCETVLVRNPDLWWPNGYGKQSLYDLEICVGDQTLHRRIGLRTIDLVTERDDSGLSFGFRVNGVPVFARGANWIPADALAGRITEAKTRDLLQSAVDANMNMIRVWGGGRYEPDSFYDACDELGLLVWQDFMFSCNLYPSTPDFLENVQTEVEQNVLRLNHHACLALWCGDNELVGALNWFEESRKDRDRYLVSYDRLNRTIEDALRRFAPFANWWPSSPSAGPLNFRDAWHEDGSGDMHFWSVWHEGRDFDHYRDVSPRFCSEFGFQSYPSMDVIKTFADPADWNIASPVLESHQKNAGGNARIAETMFRYFRWPERFEDFVWLSQIQQGLAIQTAVTDWRAKKPHCQGTLYWQLNDTWPCCSWSSLDYGGGWKMLHHMARRFYAPVTVVAVPDGEGFRLVAINDTRNPVRLSVEARAAKLDGTTRRLAQAEAEVGTVAAHDVLRADGLAPDELLVLRWSGDASGGDVIAPKPWKSYDLLDPGLALDVARDGDTWRLTLTSTALALFATIEADIPGRFSANAIHVFPGHPAVLTFTPRDPGAAPRFTTRDLWSATMRRA